MNARNKHSLEMIYDCGAGRGKTPAAELISSIDSFLNQNTSKKIDLLAISHFDNDHINGLNYLSQALKARKITVEKTWAPLLSPLETLFALARNDWVADRHSEDERLPGDGATTDAIVARPAETLTELFPDTEVQLVGPNETPTPLPPAPPMTALDEASSDSERSNTPATKFDSNPLRIHVSATVKRSDEQLWEILPYLNPSTYKASQSFSTTIGSIIGKPASECTLDDVRALTSNTLLLGRFYKMTKDNHVSAGYKRTRGQGGATLSNLPSLCVYSAPTAPYAWNRNRKANFRKDLKRIGFTPFAFPIAPGWLGTGDAAFSTKPQVDDLAHAIKPNRLDRIGQASAPHHGSRLDCCPALWDAMPNLGIVTFEGNGVTTSNRSHPHKVVVDSISTRGLYSHIASKGSSLQRTDSRYR